MKFPLVWLAVPLLANAGLLVLALRNSRRRKRILERQRQHELVQALVLGQLDAIGKLLKDESLSADELELRSAAILDEMQALNYQGQLTPLIEDERQCVAEQCAKRRAGRR
jgi:hypothetical protein